MDDQRWPPVRKFGDVIDCGNREDPGRGHASACCMPAALSNRRGLIIGRLPGETSCLTLVWAVLDRASRGWRGLAMTADGLRPLQGLHRSMLDPPRQLRPRTMAASQDGDAPQNVSAIA